MVELPEVEVRVVAQVGSEIQTRHEKAAENIEPISVRQLLKLNDNTAFYTSESTLLSHQKREKFRGSAGSGDALGYERQKVRLNAHERMDRQFTYQFPARHTSRTPSLMNVERPVLRVRPSETGGVSGEGRSAKVEGMSRSHLTFGG